MKIKAKLLMGIGLLFSMIVLLITLSSLFINKLSDDTNNILVANYNTIDYSRQMLIALNNDISNAENARSFRNNLILQQKNITETGEKELTQKLSFDFDILIKIPTDSSALKNVTTDITNVMLLNMLAIQGKSSVAQDTAEHAKLWIGIVGVICFLIAFILLVNLPGNIANPVKELTNSIKEIAAQNYSQRVHFEKQNEFGELAHAFNTMAEKLEEYRAGNLEKLMMEKKRIETLINNMHDPVLGLDENHKIIFMNDIALKIAGLKASDTIGKRVEDIAVQNDLVRSLLKDMFQSENNFKPIPIKIYADNKESYFEKEILPIKIIPTGEKEEKLIGNVILLQNITPYKELDFAKTNFIATVSHELKTPIAAIKMSLQLLENKQVGSLNTEQHNLVESIKDDAGRLLKITGELLNISQVESGVIQLNVLPSDPIQIMNYAINANRTAAEQKQIKLEIDQPSTLPMVQADTEKTSWVLTNLISNAIRYSHDNSVIYLRIASDDKTIKFSVTDSGQGIAPQYIGKIFDRYFRVPGSKKEGTGLGLSISKEFIEAQAGTLNVKSEFGAGSTFTVSLPA